jgi:putative PIN family toxin of toxin-antitoxin system
VKLVLDTNIFISAFFWGGHPRKVLERIIDNTDELYVTKEILEEITSVMSRPKFKINTDVITYFIQSIEDISQKIIVRNNIKNICRDSEDDKILECALIAKADYIITGDNDLLVLEKYENVKIITAAKYLMLF